jgi:hypothetical protein
MFSHATTGNPLTWTVADVGKWLVSINMSNHCAAFATNEIDGQCLLDMDDASLLAISVSLPVQRKKLLRLIQELFAPQGSFLHSFTPNHNLTTIFHSLQAPPLPQPVRTTHSLSLPRTLPVIALCCLHRQLPHSHVRNHNAPPRLPLCSPPLFWIARNPASPTKTNQPTHNRASFGARLRNGPPIAQNKRNKRNTTTSLRLDLLLLSAARQPSTDPPTHRSAPASAHVSTQHSTGSSPPDRLDPAPYHAPQCALAYICKYKNKI